MVVVATRQASGESDVSHCAIASVISGLAESTKKVMGVVEEVFCAESVAAKKIVVVPWLKPESASDHSPVAFALVVAVENEAFTIANASAMPVNVIEAVVNVWLSAGEDMIGALGAVASGAGAGADGEGDGDGEAVCLLSCLRAAASSDARDSPPPPAKGTKTEVLEGTKGGRVRKAGCVAEI